MVFTKNPELGQVKTRLASTVGDDNALRVYQALIKHTCEISTAVDAEKTVFYSKFIDLNDCWDNLLYQKHVQEGEDLGGKMEHAFTLAFAHGFQQVVIIGSDCIELTTSHLEEAFRQLDTNDVVIGPAHDGGYYLLGMCNLNRDFFQGKAWSTEDVMVDTMLDIKKLGLTYSLLETLGDVDHEEDLGPLKKLLR